MQRFPGFELYLLALLAWGLTCVTVKIDMYMQLAPSPFKPASLLQFG